MRCRCHFFYGGTVWPTVGQGDTESYTSSLSPPPDVHDTMTLRRYDAVPGERFRVPWCIGGDYPRGCREASV